MPRTEAGKRLLTRMTTRSTADISPPEVAIDAIEAEAREQAEWGWPEVEAQRRHGALVERARIREAVEGLDEPHRRAGPGLYLDGWRDGRVAVLAIIDREDA